MFGILMHEENVLRELNFFETAGPLGGKGGLNVTLYSIMTSKRE